MNIAIIGSGVYGKGIANLLVNSGNKVKMWTEINLKENNMILPDNVDISNSYEYVLKDAKLVYILTSCKYIESIMNNIKDLIDKDSIIIVGAKGILPNGELPVELIKRVIPKNKIAVISGPTFAVDIAKLEPVGFTLATSENKDFEIVKRAMNKAYLEYSNDLIGVSMSGSLKNAYAIGSGVLSGFDYGHSTRCLYIKRVTEEIESIFDSVNADKNTVMTLAGIGDLVLTCTSLNSRNFTYGTILSLNDKKASEEYLKNTTVEGYENIKVYADLFRKKKIEAPILMKINDILLGKSNSNELIDLILN